MTAEVTITYMDGAKVEITGGDPQAEYAVEFVNTATGELVYRTRIHAGSWAKANPRYYVPWRITVKAGDTVAREETLDLKGKRVLILLSSKALGDTVSWIPQVDEFRRVHGCEVHVATFHNHLFESCYPELRFVGHDRDAHEYTALYTIGTYDGNYDRNRNNWRLIPLQQVASDCLGLPYREIRPKVNRSAVGRPVAERYVAISEFGTFQAKQWLYPDGWQQIVDHLNASGFKVMSISKEPTQLRDVIIRNGAPIDETIRNIQYAEFYIGISSGPCVIAWALGVPTVVISGFTDPVSETRDCIRVHNSSVCHGCFNDPSLAFDRANWRYCPRNRNYECSRSITPDMVKAAIAPLVSGKIQTRPGERGRQDMKIVEEVMDRDVYGLEELKRQGFNPATVLDIGGHIGSFGAKAHRLWSDARIIAYEPNSESAALYRRNVPSAEVIEGAVSYETGKTCLAEDDHVTGGGVLIRREQLNEQGRLAIDRINPRATYHIESSDVAVVNLEEVFGRHELESVDLLKLDCEGSEIEILRQMKPETAGKIRRIVGEYHFAEGYASFEKLLRDKFPHHAVRPVGEQRPYIGIFTAAPQTQPQRILYITPHCSTGGGPQYLLRSVEAMKEAGRDVAVIEYQCISTEYIVQRNKLQTLTTVHTLNGNKASDMNSVFLEFNPDIVHLHEFPETFMEDRCAQLLYSPHRKYRIVETSHGDVLQPDKKRYMPDAFAFVSAYHAAKFGSLGVPYEVVEYEVADHERPDRVQALAKLGCDPARKHVLNVGLFTPGKNQGEAFEVARRLPGIEFHFVGNQAPNFAAYWRPLMAAKPPNCRIWGERGDVDDFYAAMDVFLFTSRKELNPIVVKEALAWHMPVLMHELPTCADQYRDNPLVRFIDDDIDCTAGLISGNVNSMAAMLTRVYEHVRQRAI